MKATTGKADIVKTMLEIRDKFSLEIMDMTFAQEKEYVKSQLAELKSKRRNRKQTI